MNENLETTKAIAKASEEGFKFGSNVINASEKFGGFMSKYIGGSLEQAFGIFEDKLKYTRWERQLRLMKRAEQLMKDKGIVGPTKAIQMKIAIPIFQAASLEENDYLQDKWASMLINASNNLGKNVSRSHISILEELSQLDARNLDMIYRLSFEVGSKVHSICTIELPMHASINNGEDKGMCCLNKEVEISLMNLTRLGLIQGALTAGGFYRYDHVSQTLLGRDFIEACRLENVIDDE